MTFLKFYKMLHSTVLRLLNVEKTVIIGFHYLLVFRINDQHYADIELKQKHNARRHSGRENIMERVFRYCYHWRFQNINRHLPSSYAKSSYEL